MLMRAGDELPRGFDLSALRLAASVGEPLNPEAVLWGRAALGLPFHDTWWQTETGAIMIANYAAMDIRLGSMGRPLPGIEAAVVRRNGQGAEPIAEPDPIAGEIVKAFIALKPGISADEALRRTLLGHARRRLGAVIAPKEIEFREHLPKTRSGKIMRRLLKAEERGEPGGDLSTLEER